MKIFEVRISYLKKLCHKSFRKTRGRKNPPGHFLGFFAAGKEYSGFSANIVMDIRGIIRMHGEIGPLGSLLFPRQQKHQEQRIGA
ncbi:MAG: hypothetical protein IJ812_07595 [Schwartzia sp.]|nr:hypothetical protein [Schwartzia sp. (in: firmicutes)]